MYSSYKALVVAVVVLLAYIIVTNYNYDNTENKENEDEYNIEVGGAYKQPQGGVVVDADDPIDVYLIPHSHCDAGWLFTLQDYYDTKVKYILTNVVIELDTDHTKKFNWADMAFFAIWWKDQTDEVKNKVKGFIHNGRWEFIGGGWVQNDEAVANYDAIIGQLTLGHQFLRNEFSVQPTVGWQIDPFGSSSLTPVLFRLANYKYLIIDRVDERIKAVYNTTPNIPSSGLFPNEKAFEFFWKPSKNYGDKVEIFTNVLDSLYITPTWCVPNASDITQNICTGFNWEEDPKFNPPITPENVNERADLFATIIKMRASWYRHKKLLIPFGHDFVFVNATAQFSNMDALIGYINRNSSYGIKIRYATVSEYFQDVLATTPKSVFPVATWENSNDFFPYTRCQTIDYVNFNTCAFYWTGFYSSYPNLKHKIRTCSAQSRAADVLYSLAKPKVAGVAQEVWSSVEDNILTLKKANAILTHHDAVTGTSRVAVLNDYNRMLDAGLNTTNRAFQDIMGYLVGDNKPNNYIQLHTGLSAWPGGLQVVPILLYNPLPYTREEIFKIHLPIFNVEIVDSDGNLAKTQINEVPPSFAGGENFAAANYDVYVFVKIPPLGYTTYYIRVVDASQVVVVKWEIVEKTNTASIHGGRIELTFTPDENLQHLLTGYKYTGEKFNHSSNLKQQLYYYNGLRDDVYKFRPNGTAQEYLDDLNPTAYTSVGPLVQQFITILNGQATQIFRVFANLPGNFKEFVEVENLVAVALDQEVVTRFTLEGLLSNGVFYTDNGIEAHDRQYSAKFDDHNSWSLIAGNYYPVLGTLFIKDHVNQLTILTKQSVGGSSQFSDSLEIMLQRRGSGFHWSLNETFNDTSVAHVPLRIFVAPPQHSDPLRHEISIDFQHPIIPFFAIQDTTPQLFAQKYRTAFSPLTGDFPRNIHLIALETTKDDVLLRILNVYDNSSFSSVVELNSLFGDYSIGSVNAVSLTAATVLASGNSELTATVAPAEIKTYQFKFVSPAPVTPESKNYWILVGLPILAVAALLGMGGAIYYYLHWKKKKTYAPLLG